MKVKLFLQIILILSILVISGVFYYSFIIDKKNKTSKSEEVDKEINIALDDKISNELINIEYNSVDDDGNIYYINAKRAIVQNDDTKKNIIELEGVISFIDIKNKGIINVYSDNAIYDKLNHNTSFFKNVKIEYLNNSIFAENLDLLFTEKISKIYNNVSLKNKNLIVETDRILIDMVAGDIKLDMMNKNEKVNLRTNYEFIN
tara:strand:+ start:411 stop:1019 length:609 start_codon:yes stop_codon:yes gene_type:complete